MTNGLNRVVSTVGRGGRTRWAVNRIAARQRRADRAKELPERPVKQTSRNPTALVPAGA